MRKTVHVTAADVAAGRAELDALGVTEHQRPKVRGECLDGPRPCLYVGCKQNLYLDVGKRGTIILNFPGSDPGEVPAAQSCALDLAEAGGMTLEEVATVTNLTRERVRQIEKRALLHHARPLAVELGLGDDK